MAELFGGSVDMDAERKPHLDIPFDFQSDCWFPCIRFSNWFQMKLLQYDCCGVFRECFYYLDVLQYSRDRLGFTEARQRAIGPTFCALGRVNYTSYEDVAKILSNTQKRGPMVGRVKLDASKCPAQFLLFESNTPEDDTHKAPRANLDINVFNTDGVRERSTDENARQIVNAFVSTLKRTKRIDPIAVNGTYHISFEKRILDSFVIRWMHYVVLGIFIETDETVLLDKMFSVMSDSGYVKRRTSGIGSILSCLSKEIGKVEGYENDILDVYLLRSPIMQTYEPGPNAALISKKDFAEQMLGVLSVAAILGGGNTLAAALSDELAPFIDRDDFPNTDDKLELFVLEVARRFCPVNHINSLSTKKFTATIGDSEVEFPANTLTSANLNMASMDESMFRDPYDFFPDREGLKERSVNFNTVGLDPEDGAANKYGLFAGDRVCPGRHLAIRMVSQAIKAFRYGYLQSD